MKKYLVVGLSVSSLLVGCGQGDASTKKDTPKSEQVAKTPAKEDAPTVNELKKAKEEAPTPKGLKYDDNGTVLIDGKPALTEQEKAKILREEDRWNTSSGGIGDKWQDEMKNQQSNG
ncbi:hypothetical protein SAMN04488574_1421, partial [Bacillus sp. 71mf]